MAEMSLQELTLSLPFDIKRHEKVFTNYFEAIMYSDGYIEYAVPSHQEKLIKILCDKWHKTRDELTDMVPREYYCDMVTWLCQETGCLSLWNKFYIGVPNPKQIIRLKQLKLHKIYTGKIMV